MAQLTPEQQQVLTRILKIGKQKGATPKQIKAAIETGLVESNLRNLSGGDADSAGWRQERASIYANPTDLNASISRFFQETAAVKDKYGRAGDLAAAVQRPAAQYRGRYQQRAGDAAALMGGTGQNGSASARDSSTTTTTRTIPGVDNSGQRQALVAAYLANTHNPDALTMLAAGLLGAKDTAAQTTTTKRAPSAASGTGGKVTSSNLIKSVQGIDALAGTRGVPITAKQEPGHAAGGDHDPAVKGATARDFGGSEQQRKALFQQITKTLGVQNAVYKGQDINVVKNGLRYQIISRDHGTGPHLHVGIRRVSG